jgi:hypothetical protein
MFRFVRFAAFSANMTMTLPAKLMLHGRKTVTNLYLVGKVFGLSTGALVLAGLAAVMPARLAAQGQVLGHKSVYSDAVSVTAPPYYINYFDTPGYSSSDPMQITAAAEVGDNLLICINARSLGANVQRGYLPMVLDSEGQQVTAAGMVAMTTSEDFQGSGCTLVTMPYSGTFTFKLLTLNSLPGGTVTWIGWREIYVVKLF